MSDSILLTTFKSLKKRPLTNSYELIKGRSERVTTFIRDYLTIVTLVRTAIAIRRYINGYHPTPSPTYFGAQLQGDLC